MVALVIDVKAYREGHPPPPKIKSTHMTTVCKSLIEHPVYCPIALDFLFKANIY